MWLIDFFKALGRLAKRAFSVAQERGLTDDLIQMALGFVSQAAGELTDNDARREWVVQQLVQRGIPESIARLAVELAVQLFKKQTAEGRVE